MKSRILFLLVFNAFSVLFSADKQELKPSSALTVSARETQSGFPLKLFGIPHHNYSRAIIKFDFSKISAEHYAGIEKAELTLKIGENTNKENFPLRIAMITQKWNKNITMQNSGLENWPEDKNRATNIDYAIDSERTIEIPLINQKELRVDIKRIVDAWLYQGVPNNGILLSIGRPVFGLPDIGKWSVNIEGVNLSLKLQGKPQERSCIQKQAIRHFPSAFLPPVKQPYIFHLFGGAPTLHGFKVINSYGRNAKPEKGELPLNWFFGPNNPYIDSEKQFVESYLKASNTALGIQVDEWQGYTRVGDEILNTEDPNREKNVAKIKWSIKGVQVAEENNPSFYTAIYWRGEDSIKPLTEKGLPDLLIIEGQSHLHKRFPLNFGIDLAGVKKRIEYARKLGVIENTIVLIGFFESEENFHPNKILRIEEVDKIIQFLRKHGPEMPGLAFYGGKGEKLLQEAEALCYNYFIKPAPEVEIISPKFNSSISTPHIEIQVKGQAKNGNTIQRYDWFIDNRLIDQTQTPFIIYDTRELEAGMHMLTVHAIDSAWNRTAVQSPIRIHL